MVVLSSLQFRKKGYSWELSTERIHAGIRSGANTSVYIKRKKFPPTFSGASGTLENSQRTHHVRRRRATAGGLPVQAEAAQGCLPGFCRTQALRRPGAALGRPAALLWAATHRRRHHQRHGLDVVLLASQGRSAVHGRLSAVCALGQGGTAATAQCPELPGGVRHDLREEEGPQAVLPADDLSVLLGTRGSPAMAEDRCSLFSRRREEAGQDRGHRPYEVGILYT